MKNETEIKEEEIVLNRLAREEMKYKLLSDILFDLQVCKLTGMNPIEYIKELKDIVDEYYFKLIRKGENK